MCAGGRERVKAHLRILFKQGEGADEKKRVDARIKRVSRRYWKRMCRWEIGAPQELARDLLRVYDFFKDLIDPATGLSFFGPDHAKRCAHELAYVAAGYLSDRPDIPLYLPTRKLTTGLQLYRNLRTSSSLEGYHQHLNDAVASSGKRCGLQYFQAATNAFDWRWTVRALVTAGILPSYVRHYHLELYELLYDLSEKLHGEGGGARTLPGWRRTKLMKTNVVRHGVAYGLEVQRIGGGGGGGGGGGAGGESGGGGESGSSGDGGGSREGGGPSGSALTGRGKGVWLAE